MKKMAYFLIILLTFTGCTTELKEEQVKGIKGFVTQIDREANKLTIVEDSSGQWSENRPLASIVTLNKSTQILDANTNKNIPIQEVQVGYMVQTWYRGSVNKSYPIQAVASKIEVERDDGGPFKITRQLAIETVLREVKTKTAFVRTVSYNSEDKVWLVEVDDYHQIGHTVTFKIHSDTGDVLAPG